MSDEDNMVIRCPFCEGHLKDEIAPKGRFLAHTEPACSKFVALEPDAFIEEAKTAFDQRFEEAAEMLALAALPEGSPRRYSKEIHVAWSFWELLRRMGFRPEQIFWVFSPADKVSATMVLRIVLRLEGRESKDAFSIVCSGPLPITRARQLEAESRRWVNELTSFSTEELDLIWKSAPAMRRAKGLFLAMVGVGIPVPLLEKKAN